MPVELGTIIAVAAALELAYGVIYPRIGAKTLGAIVKADILVTLALLVGIGWAVDGFATRYSVILIETNWIVFTLLVMGALEWPYFRRYCRRHGLNPFDDD